MSSITVAIKLTRDSSFVRLAVDTTGDFTSPVYSSVSATSGRVAKLSLAGLDADTEYFCAVQIGGVLDTSTIGKFKTPPSGPESFKCAFSGDATLGSNSVVFDQIRAQLPLFFIHMGDLHYQNIATASEALYLAAYDGVLASAKQGQLFREVPTLYMWDDHDFGAGDSYSASPSRNVACQAYRRRVPHPALVETGDTDAIYYTHEVGRVMFIFTDQRSMASNKADTDNSSKTMLGATQKAWFKGLLSDSANAGKLFVWVCSRVWGGVATAGADHWGGFTTERVELANHIKLYCADRFCVLSADMHSLAIDDGTNHDFASGGGAPTPTFQAAPLDQTGAETYGGATYSEGGRFTNNGQFGTMEITDAGGADVNVNWKGYSSTGTELVQYDFDVTLGVP